MTAWRLPNRVERERDRRLLEGFLDATYAGVIASMPIVVVDTESYAPLSLRVDAWCHRADQLIGQTDPGKAA